ncbi:MAG: hypothetical protein KJO85_07340, partial [Gammaproteobacteria bacterium]|nr:hypothetical protein [Gammaproteobacteria bacterium]
MPEPPAQPRAAMPAALQPTASDALPQGAEPTSPDVGLSEVVAGLTPTQPERIEPSTQLSPQPVSPQPDQGLPLTNKQQKMFNKKIKRWSSELASLSQSQPTLNWTHKQQNYSAHFTTLQSPGEMGIEKVLVEVSTEQDGIRLSTAMVMRRLAFSNFAQFVDRWDPNVQIHDDELDGRFHSNSEISLLYDRKVMPTFHGKVTTTSRQVNTSRSRGRGKKKEIFLGGLETGVRRIRLPAKFLPFPVDQEIRRHNSHIFNEDARITFYDDGSYGWRTVSSNAETRRVIGRQPIYLLGADKVKLFVKGTVVGKVLVHARQRIIIEGSLTYADYPNVGAASENFLGLVSDNSVEIASPEVTGPGDLNVTAAIYAKRRFLVRRYRNRENATLTLFGSLTSGSISATEPRYATRIRFDPRLEEARPPGFPMSDRYELEHWDGQWAPAEYSARTGGSETA